MINIFTQVIHPYVCLYVHTYDSNFRINRKSLPAGTVGWPSGSLTTPILFNLGLAEVSVFILLFAPYLDEKIYFSYVHPSTRGRFHANSLTAPGLYLSADFTFFYQLSGDINLISQRQDNYRSQDLSHTTK